MGLTLFDLIAGLVLIASSLMGLARGATREVTTVVAFVLAVVVALLGLRYVSPIMQQAIHIMWMANTAAVVLLFVFAYILVRLAGGALTRRVKETAGLSGLDRLLGLVIGLVRGLVVISGVALLLDAATPVERRPDWLVHGKLYPIAQTVGSGLRALAPKNLKAIDAVTGGANAPPPGPDRDHGRRRRPAPDAPQEESR